MITFAAAAKIAAPQNRGSPSSASMGDELRAASGVGRALSGDSMPHVHTLASALAGAVIASWIGWILLTGGAQVESAEACGVTTAQAIAKAGARAIPSDPKLLVEPVLRTSFGDVAPSFWPPPPQL